MIPTQCHGTALVLDDQFMQHEAIGLPDRPERIVAIRQGLEEAGLVEKCARITPADPSDLEQLEATLAWIRQNHASDYIDRFITAYAQGKRCLSDNPEAPLGERTFETTWRATHAVLATVDSIMRGEARNGFCAIRPPGHHAEHGQATGFCFVNHIAVAARFLREAYGIKRVLMVDIDLHHGNGAQHSFWDDPDFLFCSIQPDPSVLRYPGTGRENERGTHDNICNIALPGGTSASQYLTALEKRFLTRADEYKPEVILVSAGFDTYRNDPLNGGIIELQRDDFARVAAILTDVAARHCSGRMVSILEGGYNLGALGECVASYVRELLKASAEH